MEKLEVQLQDLRKKGEEILEQIDQRNSRKKIQCSSCEKYHAIGKLAVIQTHWYESPYSCTGGDNWYEGELQYVCPTNNVRNRLLFNNHDVLWQERDKFENNPEAQFKRSYKKLFGDVIDEYDEKGSSSWVNNLYVDKNRKKFGLVEKKKEEK